MPTPEPEIELVAKESGCRRNGEHRERVEVSAMRSEAGQDEDRFAFQQAARRQHPIPVCFDQCAQSHAVLTFRLAIAFGSAVYAVQRAPASHRAPLRLVPRWTRLCLHELRLQVYYSRVKIVKVQAAIM